MEESDEESEDDSAHIKVAVHGLPIGFTNKYIHDLKETLEEFTGTFESYFFPTCSFWESIFFFLIRESKN